MVYETTTPAAHATPAPARRAWRRALVIAGLGLVLSAAATWSAWNAARVRDEARFDNGVQRTQAAIEARLELYIGLLRAGAGLFAGSGRVTKEEFGAFARMLDLPGRYPGAQGIGFARQVRADELAGFEAAMRRDGAEAVSVFPAGEREEYFPIQFLEPLDRRNQHAVGYDMFSDPTRRSAMERARDGGEPAATSRVTLVQEIDPVKQIGFLVYMPVYSKGAPPTTVEERRARLVGFVYSPFRTGDLLAGVFAGERAPRLEFDVHDGAAPAPENVLFRSAAEPAEKPSRADDARLRVADREWTVRYRSTPAFDAASTRTLAFWIGGAGLVASGAMGALAMTLARSARRAQGRERELFLQKEQLRVTLASIGDAVVCTDAEGRIVFMNPVAEQLTGWDLAEARGRLLQDIAPLLNEDTRRPVKSPVDLVLRRGVTVGLANHTVLASRRGPWVPIEDSAAPIRSENGELTGVILVFHDVSEKRRSEIALRDRERLLAAVAGSAAVGLAIIRADHGHAFANEAYARAFGRSADEVLGHGAAEISGAVWPLVRPQLERALAGEPVRHELELPDVRAPGGPPRCFAVDYEPQNDHGARAVIAVMLDITERKRAEERLRVSEERRRLAVEAAALGTWDLHLEDGALLWDERARELFGVSADQAVDFDLFVSVLHPEDRERVVGLVRAADPQASARTCDIEYRIIRPRDHAERWIRATGKAHFVGAGDAGAESDRPCRMIGTVQDVTENKRKEAALRFLVELSSATQRLVEPGAIMETTARLLGEHLDVDRCAYAEVEDQSVFVITGDHPRRAASIVGRWPVAAFGEECARLMLANRPYIVVDSEDDPRIGPEDLPAYRATAIRSVICVPLHKAGRFTAAMAVHQTRPRRWSADEIYLVEMVVARCWESLERGRAIHGLRESERRFRFMAESMPQKIFTARPDGGIDYVNRRWIEFTGGGHESLREWGWVPLVHPDDREENLRRWKRSLADGAAFRMEHRFRRHDGEYRWHLTHARPMRGQAGEITMWVGSNTDITEVVQARETLAERRAELERLVDERTASLRQAIEQMEEFSYSISHDLRAPLRAMQGYAQALLEDYGNRLDADGHDYVRRIISASSRMDRLTLDVLTYGKVSREQIRPQRVSLERLVTDCVRQHVDFRETRADIVVEPPMPDVLGHEPLLMQVVSNLLGNALKFVAPRATPRVRIHAETRDGAVRLWVADNGVGVPPSHQARIWGMFERAHHAGGYAGTGIGLAIVRKAVERMGGHVGVESDGHSGSRFWVELPAAEAAAGTPPGGREMRLPAT